LREIARTGAHSQRTNQARICIQLAHKRAQTCRLRALNFQPASGRPRVFYIVWLLEANGQGMVLVVGNRILATAVCTLEEFSV
jgi:hypothetical protein